MEKGGEKMKEKVLTEEEEKIIKTAWKLGFYDSPPKITISELATKLGFSKTELEKRLKEISKKLCRSYFERFRRPIHVKPVEPLKLDAWELFDLFSEIEKDSKLKEKFYEAILGILFELHRKEIEKHPIFQKFIREWRRKKEKK